jgi:hypothetical protein
MTNKKKRDTKRETYMQVEDKEFVKLFEIKFLNSETGNIDSSRN